MNLFLLSLLAHITGLTLAAGTTVIGFVVNRRFWKSYGEDKVRALILMGLGSRFPRIIGIGLGLLLLSGFYLTYLSKGAYAEQPWFRIKMILILIVIANSIVGRNIENRVKAMVAQDGTSGNLQQKAVIFYLVQLLLFLTIFVLGVFKFN